MSIAVYIKPNSNENEKAKTTNHMQNKSLSMNTLKYHILHKITKPCFVNICCRLTFYRFNQYKNTRDKSYNKLNL